jgi:hypothetical protein
MPQLYERIQEFRREQFNRAIKGGHEEFTVHIDGREFLFNVHADGSGYGWWATVPDMYEPGSPYGAHSMISREDAALQLVSQIEEADQPLFV